MDSQRRPRATDQGSSGGDTSSFQDPVGVSRTPSAAIAAVGPVSAADQRRARHRTVVKQSYHRKLSTLKTLRGEMQQLERQFAALVTRRPQLQALAASRSSPPRGPEALGNVVYGPQCAPPPLWDTSKANETLMSLYTRATLRKEALLHAHNHLQRQLDAHSEFERKLQLVAEEQASTRQRKLPFRAENYANGSPPTAPRIEIEPLTSAECLRVAAGAYREIRAFLSSNRFLTSGVSAFGWRDRRSLEDGRLTFSLKKLLHGVDASKLARRAWEACARRLRQFYPSAMDMRHYEAQQVDANNTVLYRVMVSADRRFATKALMLVSHFHTETGGAMIIRSLDPSRVHSHKPEVATKRKRGRYGEARSSEEDEPAGAALSPLTSEQWVNVILFDRAGKDCVMDFGGIVPRNAVVGSDVWMLEVLPIALRLESELVAPLFSVAQS